MGSKHFEGCEKSRFGTWCDLLSDAPHRRCCACNSHLVRGDRPADWTPRVPNPPTYEGRLEAYFRNLRQSIGLNPQPIAPGPQEATEIAVKFSPLASA